MINTVDEKPNTENYDLNPVKGYITFADILGWKGIWKDKNLIDVVKLLLHVRDNCRDFIEKCQLEYLYKLTQGKLKKFYNTEDKISSVKNIYDNNGNYRDIIEIGKNTDDNVVNSIDEYSKMRQNADNLVLSCKAELEKNDNDEDIRKIIKRSEELSKNVSMELEKVKEKYRLHEHKFNKVFNEFEINISVELISDTFVITSNSQNIDAELYIHTNIIKKLIGECLENDMLIRGATSYGEYFTLDKVFVGSAVDDAASWHEQGDEIGVFFTPRCFFATEKETAKRCFDEQILSIKKPCLKNKSQVFETYFVNWGEYYQEYKKIINSELYKTILPEIANKIINSDNRGKELTKKQGHRDT